MSNTLSNKNHRSALAIEGFQRFVTIPIAESGLKGTTKAFEKIESENFNATLATSSNLKLCFETHKSETDISLASEYFVLGNKN